MRSLRRGPAVQVAAGESELARGASDAGTVVGTRQALYMPSAGGHLRVPWERVESATWDQDGEVLRVREVAEWGQPRPEHALALTDTGRLLQLVRERVSASVLLQRHTAIRGSRGIRVIARRAPDLDREVTWLVEYDDGIQPDDPEIAKITRCALQAAREEVGL